MLDDHSAQNGPIFLALTHGNCHYTDPGDESFDACEVTDFEDDVPSAVPPGSFEPFASVPGGGTWDELLDWGASEISADRLGMMRGGGKKGRSPKVRLPPITASVAWKRTGGRWVSLASVAADVVRGTASIEIGDVVVPESSKGMAQGDHGLAFPWYVTAVPVMFVKDGDLAG